MPKKALREAAVQLKQALDDPTGLDHDDLEELVKIHDEIEELLELSSEVPIERHRDVHERLPSAVDRFEERYPRLSRALGTLMDTLTALGI